jgi:hypothetical protein
MPIVYLHKIKDTNEVFYVGIGANEKRAYLNIGRNTHWHNIVNKYGYIIEITHKDIIWEDACLIEKYLIDFYGRSDLGKGRLCNLTDGGEGVFGVVFSDERREKIRKKALGRKLTPEHAEKLRLSNVGRKLTTEHIEKLRLSSLGRKHTQDTKEKCRLNTIGYKHTPESVEKMRVAKLGTKASEDTKEKMSNKRRGALNPNFGKKMSLEQRNKLSVSLKGKTKGIASTLENENERKRKISEKMKIIWAKRNCYDNN